MPDDLVLIAPIRQVDLPRVHAEIEGRLAVVIDVEVDLLAHLGVHVHPDILSHVKGSAPPCPLRQGRVVGHVSFNPCRYLEGSPGGKADATFAEDIAGAPCRLSYIAEREAGGRGEAVGSQRVSLPEVTYLHLPRTVGPVLVGRHGERGGYHGVAHLVFKDIAVGRVVVPYLGADVGWFFQVDGKALLEVVRLLHEGGGHLKTGAGAIVR